MKTLDRRKLYDFFGLVGFNLSHYALQVMPQHEIVEQMWIGGQHRVMTQEAMRALVIRNFKPLVEQYRSDGLKFNDVAIMLVKHHGALDVIEKELTEDTIIPVEE